MNRKVEEDLGRIQLKRVSKTNSKEDSDKIDALSHRIIILLAHRFLYLLS